MHKLHLGCGPVSLEGWINLDLEGSSADVIHDLNAGLPYPDGSVGHIFAEHVIEHFDYAGALALLRECRRVLAPGGCVRMSTPDMRWLAITYLSGVTTGWGALWQPETPCKLVNEGMRSWGHKFLFDRAQLHKVFLEAGFGSIEDREWRQSEDPSMRDLESRSYHHDLIVEARVTPTTVEAAGGGGGEELHEAALRAGVDELLLRQGEELARLRRELAVLDAAPIRVLEELARRDSAAATSAAMLSASLEEFARSHQRAAEQLALRESRIASLSQCLAAAEADRARALERISSLVSEEGAARAELAGANGEIARLREALAAASTLSESQAIRIRDLEAGRDASNREKDAIQAELATCSTELSRLQARAEAAEESALGRYVLRRAARKLEQSP